MVIMILKYVKVLEEIDKHLAAHREFLDENFKPVFVKIVVA